MYDISCIADVARSKNIQIFGMQKCGSGTVSTLCSQVKNMAWNGHSTFISHPAIIKKFNRIQRKGGTFDIEGFFRYSNGDINIALIRNPFDLFLSFYFHGLFGSNDIATHYQGVQIESSTLDGFKRFIMSMGQGKCHFQEFNLSCFYPYYDERGRFIPDFAFKLESLPDLLSLLGIRDDVIDKNGKHRSLSSVRHRSNKPRGNNLTIYDSEMRSVIENYFNYELSAFGYSIFGTDSRHIIPREAVRTIPEGRLERFYIDLPPIIPAR
tara:strand:- start:689 stop:1489 length:801 start_codon:yes stop_codon:yes gene_type:complete